MFALNLKPITIVVTDTRWDAYGLETPWSFFLFALLKTQGGIETGVLPGKYDFNVRRYGFKLYTCLFPHKN